jgi:hypothetical protein
MWYETAHGILHAIIDALEDAETGVPDRACVVPGSNVAWDQCDCGQLAVVVTRSFPSVTFPQEASAAATASFAGNCVPLVVAEITISLVRCVPGPTDAGDPPSCEALSEAARLQEIDAHAVRTAVQCHLVAEETEHRRITNFVIRGQQRVGPEGGCAGSELLVTVGKIDACPCE